MSPEVFGEYLLISRLGERSMAEVFLAVKLGDRSGQSYVLKRTPLGERVSGAIAESIRREADVLRAGRLPGVASLEDEGEVGGLPFIVLGHVRGRSLAALLAQGPLERDEVVLVARELARVLGSLHERGWVHGDVSPANVMVDDEGELCLIDLGLARRAGEARELPAGKAGYASPDAALARAAAASDDVYGWGVVVAECLLDKRLFDERDLAEAAARSAALPAIVDELPLLRRALSLEASERPAARDLLGALSAEPSAKAALAARVLAFSEVARSISRPAPRSIARAQATAPAPAPDAASKEPATRPGWQLGRRWLVALAGGVLLVFLLGFLVGRRAERRDVRTTLTLPMLPARTEVELDGKKLLLSEPGKPLPIEPGKHTLTVATTRGQLEYEFVAAPGDHVVVVTVRVPAKRR